MGRPRKPWLLSLEEVRSRYVAGESAQSLAKACGLGSYAPIIRALRETDVSIRNPGGPKGRRVIPINRQCKNGKCNKNFKTYPSSNKKYCSPECRYSSPELINLLRGNFQNKHFLSSIDEENRRAMCSVCGEVDIRAREYSRKFSENTRKWRCRTAERVRVWAIKYGADAQTITELWETQEHRCAICKEKIDSFNVDHCHESGMFRGLLCTPCNTGIGFFKDDVTRLRSAIDYLSGTQGVDNPRLLG